MIGLMVVIAVIAVVAWGVAVYNRLVTLRNRFRNAFAQIDVQLTRRYDLIPNLVETAKGYLEHERETLDAVVAARSEAVSAERTAAANPDDPEAIRELERAEETLGGALGRLLAIVEDYPDLKADETMENLMEELTSTENKVAFARQAYNDAVMAYNTARERFPNLIVASGLGFDEAKLFEVTEPTRRKAVRVEF